MSEYPINNPHDKAFRELFGHKEAAQELLQKALPKDIAAALDWNVLELQPGSYVDETLRESESDLLYKTKIQDQDCMVYCLIEHQSTEDKWMAFRLLRYMF